MEKYMKILCDFCELLFFFATNFLLCRVFLISSVFNRRKKDAGSVWMDGQSMPKRCRNLFELMWTWSEFGLEQTHSSCWNHTDKKMISRASITSEFPSSNLQSLWHIINILQHMNYLIYTLQYTWMFLYAKDIKSFVVFKAQLWEVYHKKGYWKKWSGSNFLC